MAITVSTLLAHALFLVLALVASLLLQLDAPVVRRVVVARVNQLVFESLFRGQVAIVALGHLDPFGASEASFLVRDTTGAPVLFAEGVSGRFSTVALLESLVRARRDIVIDVPRATIRTVDLRLDLDDRGLALANAFFPRNPTPGPSSPPDGHGVHVYIPRAHIEHAWVHGQMLRLPYIDADVTGLDAAFALGPDGLSAEARKGAVLARGIARGADAKGAFAGLFAMTLGSAPNVLSGRARWDGTVGSLRETARAELKNGRFDASLDVPEATADAIRSIWAKSPIGGTGNAHLEAHGPLTGIDVSAHAGLDAATFDAHGSLAWTPTKTASMHFETDGVDLRQFAPGVPSSSLGLAGDVALALSDDGQLTGHAELQFAGGRFGEMPVPPATLRTSGFRSEAGPFGGEATVVIAEPGAPTTVTLHAVPTEHLATVGFDVVARDVRLGALTRLSADLTGEAGVVGRGKIDLDNLALDAKIDTHGKGLARGPLQVGGASLTGQAHGNLLNPIVDLDLHTTDVHWRGLTVARADVSVRGRALSPHVTVHEESSDLPDADADFDVDVLDGPSISKATARLTRHGETARLQADRVRLRRSDIAVDGIRIEGLGAPAEASFDMVGDTVRLRVKAPRLDALRVARLAGSDDVVKAGRFRVDIDVSARADSASGRAHAELDGAVVGSVHTISARLDGELTGRRFVGEASAAAGELGFVAFKVDNLSVGGHEPLVRASWKALWGDVGVHGRVDLAKLAANLPSARLPFSTLRGVVDLEGRLERDSASDFTPTVDLAATTSHLFVSGGPIKTAAGAPKKPSWTLEGVDVATSVHVNGDTGFTEVVTHLKDAHGEMAVLDAQSAAVPYQAIYTSPVTSASVLFRTAFDARLSVPARDLATWPAGVLRPPLDGTLAAELAVKGPLSSPHATLTAKLTGVASAPVRLTAPVEIDVDGAYDGQRADVTVHGVRGATEVLTAQLRASVRAADLVEEDASIPWTASGKVHVADFPLSTVGPLDDRQIRGRLSGDVDVEDLHANATARATLEVKDLKVGEAAYPEGRVTVVADGKTINAEARFDQDGGYGSLKAQVAAAWGTRLLPAPDPQHTLELDLAAKHFRAAVLLPFVQGSIDELDGVIDGDAHATIDPRSAKVAVSGALAVHDGLFELANFGGELHDISGKLSVTPDGLITLRDGTAYGVSGVVFAAASARFDGHHVDGASATITIPKSRAFPLYVSGSPIGSIDGRINLTESATADGRTVNIKADVPTLHLLVPDHGSQDVQALGPIPGIQVGRHSGPDGAFVADVSDAADEDDEDLPKAARASDATQVRIQTLLGSDVSIRRGGDLRVDLSGGPIVTITDKTRVSGQIQLRGGMLNLYGKTFQIETGTVTFVGDDASNPQVKVTAGWSAPDGTQVYADFIGPLKTGKVTLRSEPPLGRNDIVQLLLFGTTDGEVANATAAAPAGAYSAGGVAGNIATQPLNRALDQFGLSAVSAKVDTSSANAKPEVEVQIAKNISVDLAHVLYLGPPPPGTAPDTTLVTVDWRFLRKWSLLATVGNAGTTIVDMVWQYRY